MGTDAGPEPLPLEQRIAEWGDPDVVPGEVLRRCREGRSLEAHALLRTATTKERNGERAGRQRRLLEDLRLWVQEAGPPTMQTLNGVGARLIGKHQPADDGCYVKTLWATLVFVPIWPLSSWLVADADGGGWFFVGRTPLVPVLRRVRSFVVRAAVLAVAAGVWYGYHERTHLDVHALNGYDVPIVVSVGARSETLQPRHHHLFAGVPEGETTFTARLPDAAEPLEQHTEALSGSAPETVVYNVHGRAVLRLDYVRYGPGEPPQGRVLDPRPVLRLPAVDYPFTTPPEQKSVKDRSFVQNSVLFTIDDGAGAVQVATYLLGEGRAPHALAMSRADLQLHPENAALAFVAARYALAADPEAGRALVRECLERVPDSVDLHRYYQELWPLGERGPLLEEYRARLAAAPDSAREHYLPGRLLEDSEEAVAAYRRAIELDPGFAESYRAWGYEAALHEDWADAERLYARYAGFGTDRALEVLEFRLLGARARRAGTAAIEAMLAEVEEEAPLVAASWRARFRVGASPAALEAAAAEVDAAWRSAAMPDPVRLEELAVLSLVAGDLVEARRLIAEGELPIGIRLLLAMSDGGTPEERADLRASLSPPNPLLAAPEMRLLALALAEGEGWEQESQRLRDDLAMDGYGSVAELLHALPRGAAPVSTALARIDPARRAAANLALAWRLERTRGADAALSRRLRAKARRLALPGTLPFTG